MSIEEGNKLIHHFRHDGKIPFPKNPKDQNAIWYNRDWNLLMAVVEKANNINEEIQRKVMRSEWDNGEDKDLDDPTGWRAWSYRSIRLSTNINEVWGKTVQFIQWYNTQSKTVTNG